MICTFRHRNEWIRYRPGCELKMFGNLREDIGKRAVAQSGNSPGKLRQKYGLVQGLRIVEGYRRYRAYTMEERNVNHPVSVIDKGRSGWEL